ncbi:MAG: mechanosensitive ion channel family protein [Gammaproteobacteria bacterium]|nr:mechanosensitive ion channel family protein [Gammaproteobacteria bacterium]
MEQFFDTIRNGWGLLEPYPTLQAIMLVVIFLVLAKLGDLVIGGVVRRITSKTKWEFDDQVIALLHRPVFVTIALFGLSLAVMRLGLDQELEDINLNLIQTIMVWVWLVFGLRFGRVAIDALSGRAGATGVVQPSTRPLFSNALAIVVIIAGAYAILVAWDINVTGLVASAGIVGLALSFAAQDTLSNLFAGMAIMVDKPYKLGDYIILDSGERGEVTDIGLRSTRLLTRDDVEITIPNGVMGAAKIINEAGGPAQRYRIRIPVGVAYGSDIDHVMRVLLDVCKTHQKIAAQPAARVRFRTFGESSLDFELLCWIANPADRGLVTHELNCEIYKAFATTGIEIPFPQRDLHIKQMPADSNT